MCRGDTMLMDDLISYCERSYNLNKTYTKCDDCIQSCSGNCEDCLEDIHFGNDRRYNCNNMLNFYVCKYSYKYASEIGNIFFAEDLIDEMESINIVSLGCGPCTDLMGVMGYLNMQDIDCRINYLGFDLNEKWKPINDYLSNNYKNGSFDICYQDIFEHFKNGGTIPCINILFLQYFLSDMKKYNDDDSMEEFIDKLIDNCICKMSPGSLIIINDINYCDTRKYFEMLLQHMDDREISYEYARMHFNNSGRSNHYNYGEEYSDNDLIFNIPQNIVYGFNPWTFCSSAQLIVRLK